MNIVVDAGNSFYKAGVFDAKLLHHKDAFSSREALQKFLQSTPCDHLLVSSVATAPEQISGWSIAVGRKFVLHPELALPVGLGYKTPETLGMDRLAAACGAQALFPGEPSLVIDLGTCINYEFVNGKGVYLGGAISPGMKMRFEAMHTLTAKLPLASPLESANLTGNSTLTCLQSGVMNGILEEIKGIISRYQRDYPGTRVILCGGDTQFFENHLKPSIFVAPELVLMGLNSILLHNVEA